MPEDTEKKAPEPQPTVQRQVVERTVVREVTEPAPGPNATTTPPDGQYFTRADGVTQVNAFDEVKDSPEDKRRRAAAGIG